MHLEYFRLMLQSLRLWVLQRLLTNHNFPNDLDSCEHPGTIRERCTKKAVQVCDELQARGTHAPFTESIVVGQTGSRPYSFFTTIIPALANETEWAEALNGRKHREGKRKSECKRHCLKIDAKTDGNALTCGPDVMAMKLTEELALVSIDTSRYNICCVRGVPK